MAAGRGWEYDRTTFKTRLIVDNKQRIDLLSSFFISAKKIRKIKEIVFVFVFISPFFYLVEKKNELTFHHCRIVHQSGWNWIGPSSLTVRSWRVSFLAIHALFFHYIFFCRFCRLCLVFFLFFYDVIIIFKAASHCIVSSYSYTGFLFIIFLSVCLSVCLLTVSSSSCSRMI